MRLLNLVNKWASEVDGLSPLFVKWTTFAMISACLQRKVYYDLKASGRALPTLYVLLVGLPGCGKSFTLGLLTRNLLRGLQGAPIMSPSQVTPAALVEDIITRVHGSADVAKSAHSTPYFILSSEFQVFFRDFGGGNIMPYLLDWFDYRDPYELWSKGTRSVGLEAFANPAITVLGATAPSYLRSEVVSQAGADGLASRFVFVNDHNVYSREFEAEREFDPVLTSQIKYEFQRLLDFPFGVFVSSKKAVLFGQALVDENTEKLRSALPNSTLREFYARRVAHIQSLALIYAATETNFDALKSNYTITEEHLTFARDTYDELEQGMSALFGYQEVSISNSLNIPALRDSLNLLAVSKTVPNFVANLSKFDIILLDPENLVPWLMANQRFNPIKVVNINGETFIGG